MAPMHGWRGAARGLAAALTLVLAPAAAGATDIPPERFEVEVFGPDGRSEGPVTLYDGRRALILADAGAQATADARAALTAWLRASGFAVAVHDGGREDGAPRAAETVLSDWLARNDLSRDGLLLVVVDAPVAFEAGGDRLSLDLGAGRERLDLERFLRPLLRQARARHVLAVLTAPALGARRYMNDAETRETPLSRGTEAPARLLLGPRLSSTAPAAVLEPLSRALRGDLGAAFDSDAFVTAADLVRTHADLTLLRAHDDLGGMAVLSRYQRFERPARADAPDRRAAFEALDAGRAADLRAFAAAHPDTRDGRWARLRLEALEARRQAESARACERSLAFPTEAILHLGLAVTAEIGPVDRVADIAGRWLGDVGRSTGIAGAMADGVLAECRQAGPPPPARALAMAAVSAGRNDAREAIPPLAVIALEDRATRRGAAVLGALALAASPPEGPGAGIEPALAVRLRTAVAQLAAEGDRAAMLLQGLLRLAEREVGPGRDTGAAGAAGLAAIRAAAAAGMPLAQGLYGALALRGRVAEADTPAALAMLEAARRRGLRVGREAEAALADLAAQRLERGIAACRQALGIDARSLLDPWHFHGQADLMDAFGRLPALLGRRLEGASLGDWRAACAVVETGPTALASLSAAPLAVPAVPDDLLLALAALRLREGESPRALALLARVGDAPGLVAFLKASIRAGDDPEDPAAMVGLRNAALAGSAAAGLYLALPQAGPAGGPEAERLRAAVLERARAGMPAAQYLQAVFETRSTVPFAAIRAHVWVRRAAAAGFAVEPTTRAAIRGRALTAIDRDLGLGIDRLTPQDRERIDYRAVRETGVLVREVLADSAAAAGGIEADTVIVEINRAGLDGSVARAREQMLAQLVAQGAISGLGYLPNRWRQSKTRVAVAAPPALAGFLSQAPQIERRAVAASTLRAGPGTAFAALAQTAPGETVQLLSKPGERPGDWVRVGLERGGAVQGYLPAGALGQE